MAGQVSRTEIQSSPLGDSRDISAWRYQLGVMASSMGPFCECACVRERRLEKAYTVSNVHQRVRVHASCWGPFPTLRVRIGSDREKLPSQL